MIQSIKKNWELISACFLWLCIWATYNTDITRIFLPGFPHNKLDLIHGLRSLLPFLAIILAAAFLFKKRRFQINFFLTPLGLLSIYTIVGIFSSIFSKDPLVALYWSVLYGSAIIVLLAVFSIGPNPLKRVSFIVNINWVIAGVITLGLLLFFLIQPGAISSLTYNFLICSQRPYETLGNISAEINTLGMAGTRPTGLGRYAGVIAIVAFASFLYSKKNKILLKFVWLFLFILFFLILLFSKGRTEIVGFIIAIIFIIFAGKKFNLPVILGTGLIILLIVFPVFYNIPCTNSLGIPNPFSLRNTIKPALASKTANLPAEKNATVIPSEKVAASLVAKNTPGPYVAPANLIPSAPKVVLNSLSLKNKIIFSTLSGRTTGIWPEAWHLFLKDPLMGFGFQADRFFLGGQHAHNALLQALVQTGLLGTIPLILAFIITFVYLCRALGQKDIEERERRLLMGIAGVFIFFAVRSIPESSGAYFDADWLFLAPIIAYLQFLPKRERNNLKMDFCQNRVDLLKTSDVVEKIKYWIKNESQKLHWIIVTGMHGIVEAEKHASFKYIISYADMFVPDGISLVWLARLKGFDIKKRVSGADLMQEFFKVANKEGFRSYFYGDTEETLRVLNKKISSDFPNLKIAGSYSPPFKNLTPKEDAEIIQKINQAKPDVLWVALGLPKQEKWIFEHREKLNVPVVIGVGAAFKFLSGKVKRAPAWVGNLGLEWLWRLFKEPKTTWKRVFIDMPFFVWLAMLEIAGFKSYKE